MYVIASQPSIVHTISYIFFFSSTTLINRLVSSFTASTTDLSQNNLEPFPTLSSLTAFKYVSPITFNDDKFNSEFLIWYSSKKLTSSPTDNPPLNNIGNALWYLISPFMHPSAFLFVVTLLISEKSSRNGSEYSIYAVAMKFANCLTNYCNQFLLKLRNH